MCLPVPEKAQRQFNFCIIPKNGDGVTTVPEGQPVPDTMVWTVPDGPPKAAFTGNGQRIEGSEHGEALIRRMLDSGLGRTKVIRPDDREFVSATPEAHRKGEKAYHVKAHKGSKDGMFFCVQPEVALFIVLIIPNCKYRLFVFSFYRYSVWIQETAVVLFVCEYRLDLVHFCPPANIQPQHRHSGRR